MSQATKRMRLLRLLRRDPAEAILQYLESCRLHRISIVVKFDAGFKMWAQADITFEFLENQHVNPPYVLRMFRDALLNHGARGSGKIVEVLEFVRDSHGFGFPGLQRATHPALIEWVGMPMDFTA